MQVKNVKITGVGGKMRARKTFLERNREIKNR